MKRLLLAFLLLAHADCLAGDETLPDIDISGSKNGIVDLQGDVPAVFRDVFVRYTKFVAPSGEPIHFLAQSGWTDAQIEKARNVLEYILTGRPGSRFGSDKTAVANAMADRRATMVLFDDVESMEEAFDGPLGDVDLSMQDLRANECPVEGSQDYLNHVTRDASFEEIWHLVHDYGVKPTLPEMIAEMRAANDEAAGKGWRAWPEDEPWEHPNEYVGVLLDNYLDLWTVRPKKYEGEDIPPEEIPEGTSHFGVYFAGSRERMRELDPRGFALVESFFPDHLTYTVYLPADYHGHFSLTLDELLPYTWKSQHLRNVTLRDDSHASVTGNRFDNVLIGNDEINILDGGGGSDVIDGRGGEDIVSFPGPFSDYRIDVRDDHMTVTLEGADPPQVTTVRNIRKFHYADQQVRVQKR